jgi:S-adenosylmethionine decarboxylase
MFPERQLGPHRDWKQEVEFLDNIFENGSAYTVGKVNGDHWLLYLTNPNEDCRSVTALNSITKTPREIESFPDYTLEILMSDLADSARESFYSTLSPCDDPHIHAAALSAKLGITDIFPSHLTTLDAYSFSPCGYSANALIKWGPESHASQGEEDRPTPEISKEGYYTIHVTPEAGWSYASFECNVPSHSTHSTRTVPDLRSLIQRVVAIFKPGRLSLTLFISKEDNDADQDESIETAQQAFKSALSLHPLVPKSGNLNVSSANGSTVKGKYKRTDKINYEFGGYDLAFASFELVA